MNVTSSNKIGNCIAAFELSKSVSNLSVPLFLKVALYVDDYEEISSGDPKRQRNYIWTKLCYLFLIEL